MLNISNLKCVLGGHEILHINQLSITVPGLYIFSGPSGCGKTTLLNIIVGLEKQYEGNIFVFNRNFKKIKEKDIVRFRASHLSIYFQHHVFLEDLSLEDNVQLCGRVGASYQKTIFKDEVNHLCNQLKISNIAQKKVKTLSGGEKTRAGIARALAKRVPLYIFDEPTAALDSENAIQVMNLIKKKAEQSIVLLVTHDLALARIYGHRLYHMSYGQIIKEEVLSQSSTNEIFAPSLIDYRENAPYIARKLILAKRYRHLITGASINLGLVGIGLSLLLVSAVNAKLVQAFKGHFSDKTAYLHSTFAPQINKIKSPNDEDIYLSFGGDAVIGSFYVNNMDTFFPDINELTVSIESYRLPLPSFHIGLFNEAIFLNEVDVSPRLSTLKDDELALVLPQDDFKLLQNMFGLPYKNNVSDLAQYLGRNDVVLILNIANKAWDYEDEFSYVLRAVTLGDKAQVVLNGPHQIRELFEKKLPFPTSLNLNQSEDYPWVLKKINYLFSHKPFEILWDQSIYSKYLPFTANRAYFLHIDNDNQLRRRLLIYETPPAFNRLVGSLSHNVLPTLFTCNKGLIFIPDLLILGFSNHFIMSADSGLVDDFIQTDKSYHSILNPDIELDPKMINFSVQYNGLNSFHFDNSGYINSLTSIGISKGLANKLFGTTDVIGKDVYVGALTNISDSEHGYQKDYQTITLRITEVVNSSGMAIYQHPLWPYLLYKDGFGVSPFELEITGALFVHGIEEQMSIDDTSIKTRYPYQSFKETIDKTVRSLESYTTIVALGSFLLSVLITFVVIYLLTSETNDQFSGLYLMGYEKEAIQEVVTHYIVYFIGAIILFSLVQLFVLSFVIEWVLMDFLKTAFYYTFRYQPYLWVLLLTIPVMVGTLSFFKRQMHRVNLFQFSKRDL